MKKFLIFSDPHYSVNSEKSEEKWFPPICDFLEKIGCYLIVEKFLRFWDAVTQRAFERMIKKAKELEPYDLAIGLGDYTPGANEKGMLTEKTRTQFAFFKSILDGIKCFKKLIWGDHDVGYWFNVSKRVGVKIGTEKGGMSKEGVRTATELIGPPFGCFFVNMIRFIFISTNLIRNVDKRSDEKLQRLQLEQENFLAKALNSSNKGKTILLLHDPTALVKKTSIRKIMDSHQGKITAIMHGHMHAEFSRKIAMLSPVYRNLCKEYETILVPAPWGMMGIGGGFLVMDIYYDGSYQIEKYKLRK